MKKQLFFLFLALVFIGCAGKTQLDRDIVQSSEAIFIDKKPKNNKAFVKFTNTSNLDSNLTEAISLNLANNGYEIVDDKELASTKIYGNLNYFRRTYIKDIDPFVVSSINFRYRGYRRYDILDDYYSSTTNSYIYDAQISLLIDIDGEKYQTNLNYQSDKNINSTSTAQDIFNAKISKQILGYLGFANYN
ncbi:MAG: hypothetical protein GX282_07075 [Campylobacteraceae bacterium]|nr:hypothetical protein [Campylobacteraceae bacterium]